MRIKSIQLTWFRGAADPVPLELDCKSMVIYGKNGSGKSSFVDALEYVLSNGKIRHLAHEYSGKRQQKAVPNTKKPPGRKTELKICFQNDLEVTTEIRQDGSFTSSGPGADSMRMWDYRRTVLRQDEVASFIHETKGHKYSALLPLLGLQQMEVAAENLRQLAKTVEVESQLRETKAKLGEVVKKRKEIFGADTDDEILAKIQALHAKYCEDRAATEGALARCKELMEALETRIAASSADQRRHLALQAAAELDLQGEVSAVRSASAKLAATVEPLIAEKLEVLHWTVKLVDSLQAEKEVECPACGRTISVADFEAHVKAERQRLYETNRTFETRKKAIATLCDTIKSLRSSLTRSEVESWRSELAKGSLGDNLAYLNRVDPDALRESFEEDDLGACERKLLPLIEAAGTACKSAPPEAQQLSNDRQKVELAESVIKATEQTTAVQRTETLVSFISSVESGIREEIRLRSQDVIAEISLDIQGMWATLHPDEAIEHVELYVPEGVDKAIDIGLTFHGVQQNSPRLTLSEGYRNSLGLAIFLALAKREEDNDRPLFLDDVVVSMDRQHRGMVAELLERDFSRRQVVILTHDRQWYTELRHQLDSKKWGFKALLPYETPDIGIRWSHKTTTFDDARAQLQGRPDSAGNDARKIMDVELALIAERLRIKLPFLRGDKNDKRMAHDFLVRLVADGERCFEKKSGDGYKVHGAAIEVLEKAKRLLVTWANHASHTFDLERQEATKLIDVCEEAVDFFKCSACRKYVWFADAKGAKALQCECSQLRWRYGKA